MFQFELVVTENCNLRCKYCYMKRKESMMSIDIFNKHLEMLPRLMIAHLESEFTTVFFGGEPLINWKLIVYAIEKLRLKSKGFTIPTNGLLLTKDKILYLKQNNVNLSLSFDGLWNEQFDDYMSMFINDEYPGLFQNCKIMVAPDRSTTLKENYQFCVDTMDNDYPDFTLVRDDIWNPADVRKFKIELKVLADTVIEYIASGIETMPGIFSLYMLDTIMGYKHGKRNFACFAGCHGAAFMPDGKVFPCARFGNREFFPLANSNNMFIYSNAKLPVHVTNPENFEKCQKCELFKYCNSGCTYNQMRLDGKCQWRGQPVDNVCLIFKECYKQAHRITEELKNSLAFKNVMKTILRRSNG